MQGQLHEIDLLSLLKLIALGQRTGELWVEAQGQAPWQTCSAPLPKEQAGRSWLLSFIQGQLVHGCRTSDRTNRLEDCLQRLSPPLTDPALLAAQHSTESQATEPKTTEPYSTEHHCPEYAILWQLFEQQQLRPDQGRRLVRQLSEETLFELAILRQGRFRFEQSTALPPHITSLRLGPLIHRLERSLTQWQQLYPAIAALTQCPVLLNPEAVQARLPSSAFAVLARWANGSTSLLQLARRLNRHPVDVAQALYPYIQAKFIRLQAQPSSLAELPPVPTPAQFSAIFADRLSGQPSERPSPEKSLQAPAQPNLGSNNLGLGDRLAQVVCLDADPTSLERLMGAIAQVGGVQAQGFSSSLEALPAMFDGSPDLVIISLTLADIPGDQLCSMWRQIPRFRQLPIILITESPDFLERTRAKMAGATDYLAKPLGGDELLMLLEKYIGPIPSAQPVFYEAWRSDALPVKLGHDNGEAKFTSTN